MICPELPHERKVRRLSQDLLPVSSPPEIFLMNDNVIFFLQFKKDLQFFYDTLPLSEALVSMKKHGFTAVPVITANGEYAGSVSEGDFLWYLLEKGTGQEILEATLVKDLIRPDFMPAVHINVSKRKLLDTSLHQNYVPVVDDRNIFIGIVTRQALLKHYGLPKLEKVDAIITPEISKDHSSRFKIRLRP